MSEARSRVEPGAGWSNNVADLHDGVLTDLDGVVYKGRDAVQSAVAAYLALDEIETHVGYVTNNASRTPEVVAAQLRGFGLHVRPEDIVTSAQATVPLLAAHVPAPAEVLLVGASALADEIAAAGYSIQRKATPSTAAVVQGFSPETGWEDLAEASYAIEAGAYWVASNPDLTIPKERGVAPGNGSLVAAVANATGEYPDMAGKPGAAIFLAALERLGMHDPVMIGDRLDTDIVGGNAAGIATALVLTGIDQAQALLLAPVEQRPTYVFETCADLLAPMSSCTVTGSSAFCGGAEVAITGGHLELLAHGHTDLDALRAANALLNRYSASGASVESLHIDTQLMQSR